MTDTSKECVVNGRDFGAVGDGRAGDPATVRGFLHVADGRSVLDINGRRLTALYSETLCEGMHRRNRQMAKAGVDCFMLIVRGGYGGDYHTSWFWRDDGVYGDESDRTDDFTLDRQAAEILAVQPDACFMVRWGSGVPKGWAEKHPDELQFSSAGGRRRESSYTSRLAAEGRAEQARVIVRFVESRPWADRVVGYLPFGEDEGTTNLAIGDSLFDESPAATREFRRFLAERYGTDEALRMAWGDPAVTLAGATAPSEAEWLAVRKTWLHWPKPVATARYRDFFLTLRELLFYQRRTELGATKAASRRPVFAGTDALKQPMFGWLIRDAFEGAGLGMSYRNMLLGSGSIGVGPLLDSPELDALITPADYTARSCGFGFEPEGIGDSLVLRGKTIFVEDDARSWATGERETQGAWRTVEECRAGLLRNLAVCASRGFIPYWMNVGGGYFDEPEVLKVAAGQVPIRATLLSRPHRHTEHAIAMILDDESPLDEDFTTGFQNLAVLRQRTDHLALTGLPYRVHLLSDVERKDFPVFRAYLLPNLFRLTPARLRLIRRKLLANGSVVICGPGTGLQDGKTRSAKPASNLLGIPMELVEKESARRVRVYGGAHPALAGVPAGEVYGDSHPYGPILQPAERVVGSGAVELGKVSAWWTCNRAGLVLKEFGRGAAGNGRRGPRGPGDGAIVFSMAAPISGAVLRGLALYGGCVPWSDAGDVVAASDTLVAVHGVRPGPRTIRLPRPARVTDAVSGKLVSRRCARFEIRLKAPDTRVFLLD
jgi:hypothetical protein